MKFLSKIVIPLALLLGIGGNAMVSAKDSKKILVVMSGGHVLPLKE